MPDKLVPRLSQVLHVSLATGVASHLVSGWTAVLGIDVPEFERMSGLFIFTEGRGFAKPDDILLETGSTPNNYLFAREQFAPALGIYYNRAQYYGRRRL